MFVNKCAGDKWIGEVINGHSVVVQVQFSININLFFFNLLLCSCFSAKCSQLKISIIDVSNCKIVSIGVLFNFLQFYIIILPSTYFLFKCDLVIRKTILVHIVFFIILFCNCHCVLRIICDHHRYYWPHSDYIGRLGESRK